MTASRTTTIKTRFTPIGGMKNVAVHPNGTMTYFAVVTPSQAAEILNEESGININNRKMRGKGSIDGFERDMKEGRFMGLNGETIKFSVRGSLDDGQHRLKGIVQSLTPQELLIVENVAIGGQDTVDKGSRRSMGDTLTMNGFDHTSGKAAIAKNVLVYHMAGYIADTGSNGYNPTDTEILDFVSENDAELLESCVRIKGNWRFTKFTQGVLTPAMVGAIHFLCRINVPDMADEFFSEQVVMGLRLSPGDPAWALRNYASGERKGLKHHEQFAFIAKSWNAYCSHKEIKVLKPPMGGWLRDDLPKLMYVD